MAIAECLITMLAQWGKAAQTNIPTPPVPGIAYRNESLTAADFESGQAYDKVYDSARYNQVDYLATGLVQGVEQYGILPWSSLTNYPASGICMGLDGILYQALQASGPANGGAQPTSNAAYWTNYIALFTSDKYDIGQYYMFQDELERPGHFPCMGGLVASVSQKYPKIVEYLQSAHGQFRCVTQAEYDELHVYSWHTNADGTKVGWDGIGGVNRFVLDLNADTLRLPDLRGMSPEMVSATLGVGDVQPWGIPEVTGTFRSLYAGGGGDGPFAYKRTTHASIGVPSGSSAMAENDFVLSRVMPTTPKVQTASYVSLLTVYFGIPS